jgi:hypothetical protein
MNNGLRQPQRRKIHKDNGPVRIERHSKGLPFLRRTAKAMNQEEGNRILVWT